MSRRIKTVGEDMPCSCRHERNLSVSNGFDSVHPIGHPMSHSTQSGFRGPPVWAFSGRLFLLICADPPLFAASCVVGVAHLSRALTASMSVPPSRPFLGVTRPPFSARDAVGVGQDSLTLWRGNEAEDTIPLVVRARFGSTEHVPLRIRPELGHFREHLSQTSRNKPPHVLEEHERGLALLEHAQNMRPKVPWVLGRESFSCDGERLTRESRSDEIHDSTPLATVEGGEVTVDRSGVKDPAAHSLDQTRCDIGFPFHPADGAGGGDCEPDSKVEPPNPGT